MCYTAHSNMLKMQSSTAIDTSRQTCCSCKDLYICLHALSATKLHQWTGAGLLHSATFLTWRRLLQKVVGGVWSIEGRHARTAGLQYMLDPRSEMAQASMAEVHCQAVLCCCAKLHGYCLSVLHIMPPTSRGVIEHETARLSNYCLAVTGDAL